MKEAWRTIIDVRHWYHNFCLRLWWQPWFPKVRHFYTEAEFRYLLMIQGHHSTNSSCRNIKRIDYCNSSHLLKQIRMEKCTEEQNKSLIKYIFINSFSHDKHCLVNNVLGISRTIQLRNYSSYSTTEYKDVPQIYNSPVLESIWKNFCGRASIIS